jgi:hypothetical protein
LAWILLPDVIRQLFFPEEIAAWSVLQVWHLPVHPGVSRPKETTMCSRLFSLPTVVLGLALLAPASAQASDCAPVCCTYKTVVCYRQVTAYESQRLAYTRTVTCYDECGRPYTVSRVYYRDVQVPVTRTVAVTHRVRAYE